MHKNTAQYKRGTKNQQGKKHMYCTKKEINYLGRHNVDNRFNSVWQKFSTNKLPSRTCKLREIIVSLCYLSQKLDNLSLQKVEKLSGLFR